MHESPAQSWKRNVNDLKLAYGDFPGGTVVRTLHFYCWGTGLIPDCGTKIPHDA